MSNYNNCLIARPISIFAYVDERKKEKEERSALMQASTEAQTVVGPNRNICEEEYKIKRMKTYKNKKNHRQIEG